MLIALPSAAPVELAGGCTPCWGGPNCNAGCSIGGASVAAVSTVGAKAKRGRSTVHKAAHAQNSLRGEEEGILSANEGLLQLSAKEARGDSRLGGIRESHMPSRPHAAPPRIASLPAQTHDRCSHDRAGKRHLRNTRKIGQNPKSSPCCCRCRRWPEQPQTLNPRHAVNHAVSDVVKAEEAEVKMRREARRVGGGETVGQAYEKLGWGITSCAGNRPTKFADQSHCIAKHSRFPTSTQSGAVIPAHSATPSRPCAAMPRSSCSTSALGS